MFPVLRTFISHLSQPFLDVLAPRLCLLCENVISNDSVVRSEFMCASCLDSLETAPSSEEILNELIKHFPEDGLYITRAISRYASHQHDHKGLLSALYSLKYEGFSRLGREFGRELGELLCFLKCTEYDALIPVPIHPARRRERGYNQAELIAAGMSEVMKIKTDIELLQRVRYTSTQTHLSKIQRQANVSNAFSSSAQSDAMYNGTFLVVDDVLTTGSTLNTIASQLLESGARRVDVATVIKAL